MTLTLIDIDLFPAKIYLEYILHQKPPSSWCCETADITAEPSITFQYLKQQREVISCLRFLLRRCSCPGVLADQGMGGWSCNQFCLRGLCATLCRAWRAMVSSVCSRPPARSHATLCDQTSSSAPIFRLSNWCFVPSTIFVHFLSDFYTPAMLKHSKVIFYSEVSP